MQSEQQANQQELYSSYASENELVMTEEIKQVLDEQSKEIWKEIEEKLFDEFAKGYNDYLLKTFTKHFK